MSKVQPRTQVVFSHTLVPQKDSGLMPKVEILVIFVVSSNHISVCKYILVNVGSLRI
jgi:hypothetical protein